MPIRFVPPPRRGGPPRPGTPGSPVVTGDRRSPGGGDVTRSAGPAPTPPTADREPRREPWIVVHCASETTHRDGAIEAHRDALNRALMALEADSQEPLATLRRRLLAIALVIFLLTTIGGYVLVGFGLAPLRRLTEAVSRVSPRNFRLPLPADEPLP